MPLEDICVVISPAALALAYQVTETPKGGTGIIFVKDVLKVTCWIRNETHFNHRERHSAKRHHVKSYWKITLIRGI